MSAYDQTLNGHSECNKSTNDCVYPTTYPLDPMRVVLPPDKTNNISNVDPLLPIYKFVGNTFVQIKPTKQGDQQIFIREGNRWSRITYEQFNQMIKQDDRE